MCARLVLFVWAARQARSKGGFLSARALKALASPTDHTELHETARAAERLHGDPKPQLVIPECGRPLKGTYKQGETGIGGNFE